MHSAMHIYGYNLPVYEGGTSFLYQLLFGRCIDQPTSQAMPKQFERPHCHLRQIPSDENKWEIDRVQTDDIKLPTLTYP